MIGGVLFRLGGASVLGVAGAGGGFFDCASFMDRGLNVRSSVLYLVGTAEEALEEEGGEVFGAALLELVAAGEGEEGLAGLGDGGEEGAELGELGGASAVLEGVEVAGWGAGAGASAAPTGTRTVAFGHRWTQISHRLGLPAFLIGRRSA